MLCVMCYVHASIMLLLWKALTEFCANKHKPYRVSKTYDSTKTKEKDDDEEKLEEVEQRKQVEYHIVLTIKRSHNEDYFPSSRLIIFSVGSLMLHTNCSQAPCSCSNYYYLITQNGQHC